MDSSGLTEIISFNILGNISLEILLNIIYYLDEKDIFNVRHTCVYLYHLMDNKFVKKLLFPNAKNICNYSFEVIYKILHLTYPKYSKIMHVRDICICNRKLDFVIPILNTKFLSLNSVNINSDYFESLIHSLTNLKTIKLTKMPIDILWKNIEKVFRIENLFLYECWDHVYREKCQFNKSNSQLRIIYLRNCNLKCLPNWFYTDTTEELYISESIIEYFLSGISDIPNLNILRIEKVKTKNFPLLEISTMKIPYSLLHIDKIR